jgi:crotonobetainyl-CoA:carnitine CoA-transferase CaiB-like acyl-CoA transferase
MTNSATAPGPLAGLRVIELGDRIGQWCGKLMADFGAEVIKVEPPGGARERAIGPFYKDVPDPNRSLHFWHYNTSKKGITLDLGQSEGRELFRKLVASADVLLETTRAGTLLDLGLTYDSLSASNPGLVMCSLTDFGQEGPWRHWLATDMLHLAAGGQMAGSGYDAIDDSEQRPIAPGGGQGYQIGGHYAYIAIMSALFHRNMTGQGQYLDVSAHEAAALTTESHVPQWIYTQRVVQRQTGRHAGATPSQPSQIPSGDGRYLNTGGQLTPQRLKGFVEWMDSKGIGGELKDPKYQDPQVMQENQATITKAIREIAASIPADEAFRAAQEVAGMPWGIVRAPDDLPEDEHFRSRGFFLEVEHPELGERFEYPGAGAVFSASPQRIYRRAPLLGEDNAAVYSELGIDAAELAKLQAAGIV